MGDENMVKERGLFRAFLGGHEATVASTFSRLATANDIDRTVDERLGLFHARVALPEEDGSGFWRFLSISDDIFVVLTDCTFSAIRHEHVMAEGLVEFHFLLEGPVALSLPQTDDATEPPNVSLMSCQPALGMAYDVVCQPGTYKMASLYILPTLLEKSFGLNTEQGTVRQLLHPAAGTMAMVEQKIDREFIRVLRDLFGLDFGTARVMPMALALIIELLTLSADAIDRGSRAKEGTIIFTARELAMFKQAQEILATDFSETLTIPHLAKRLGTNVTKLKSGFRLLYGTTIFAYRNRYRMDLAMDLLTTGSMSVAEVSQTIGFRHQASFTSAFRAHFGLIPKQVRRRVVQGTA